MHLSSLTDLRIITLSAIVLLLFAAPKGHADQDGTSHSVLLQGGNRMAIIEPDGSISWEMEWGEIHDIHWLSSGNILTRQKTATVVEIDPETKQVVWSYDSATANGNEGKKIEVHAFARIAGGHTMIAESGAGRIIEVDSAGKIHKEIKLVLDHPNAHSDTRLVRGTPNDTYLVAQEADGKVREYSRNGGQVVWE